MRHKQGHWVWTPRPRCGEPRTASRRASWAPTWTSAHGASSKPRFRRTNGFYRRARQHALRPERVRRRPQTVAGNRDSAASRAARPAFARAQVSFRGDHPLQRRTRRVRPGDVEALADENMARARSLPHPPPRARPPRRRGAGHPRRAAGRRGFVTTYTDISARRHAEEEAQRSGQLLRGAIDAIDEAFVLYDPDDRLVLCNDRDREIYAGVPTHRARCRASRTSCGPAPAGRLPGRPGRVDAWVTERLAAHRRPTAPSCSGWRAAGRCASSNASCLTGISSAFASTSPNSRAPPRRRSRPSLAKSRVPGQHEPRDPHADECRPRHVALLAEDRADAAAARLCRKIRGRGTFAAGVDQRHPGLLQDRGRQARRSSRPTSASTS